MTINVSVDDNGDYVMLKHLLVGVFNVDFKAMTKIASRPLLSGSADVSYE